MSKQMSGFGVLIFSAVFIIGGYMAHKYIVKPIEEEAQASQEWPYVTGEITYSDMNSHISDGKKMYAIDIRYNYVVGSKSYEGTGVTVADNTGAISSTSNKSSVKKTLKKYPKGKQVKVYYDPDFPESSVLETGMSFLGRALCKLPWVFVFFGAWMLLSVVKRIFLGR